MAKEKTIYTCTECGGTSPRWLGKCPSCEAWNTLIRVQEVEADRFGLNLSREPLGEAEVDLKLTEYRKPDPGPIEEFIFFDHPSTRFRVHDAMRWREAMQKDGPDKPWSAAKK